MQKFKLFQILEVNIITNDYLSKEEITFIVIKRRFYDNS